MNFIRDAHKIYAKNDLGKIICQVDFPSLDFGEITITHTIVDDSIAGQGVAKMLIDEVCKIANEENLKIVPYCSYAVKYFEKYGEHSHLLK